MSPLFLIARLTGEVAQMDRDKKKINKKFDRTEIRDSHVDTQSNFQKVKGIFDLV